MKKLTAGIFATLLAVVSVGAAHAEIASKGYVDQQVGTKADAATVTTLQGTVSSHTTQIAGKADKATTLEGYGITDGATKTELTEGLEGKLDTAGTAAKATADASGNEITKTYATKTELGAKANTADLGALATKDTVSAAEIDADAVTTEKILDANVTKAKLASDIQTSLGKADSALQQGALADYAKTAEVASTYETKENAASTYETKANASATYETKANASATYETKTNAAATYATKEEIAGMATDANLAKKQDKTDNSLQTSDKTVVGAINEVRTTANSANSAASAADSKAQAAQSAADEAQADATQALEDAAAAQTTANAAIPKVNAEGSDGKYVLTATAANGVATYKWELIERGSAE